MSFDKDIGHWSSVVSQHERGVGSEAGAGLCQTAGGWQICIFTSWVHVLEKWTAFVACMVHVQGG